MHIECFTLLSMKYLDNHLCIYLNKIHILSACSEESIDIVTWGYIRSKLLRSIACMAPYGSIMPGALH